MKDVASGGARTATPECPGRPVVVMGMDRSGTSLTASLVHRWGAFGGDADALRKGNRENPRGYFEHLPMARFLVGRLGTEFWTDGYRDGLREKARDPAVRAEALELMEEMRAGGEVWFWKEPWLSVMLPFWETFWRDRAAYVIVLRDPWKCAVSWNNFLLEGKLRERLDLRAWALLRWQIFMLSILDSTENRPGCLFIRYEDLVASPHEQAARLAKFLDSWRGGPPTPKERLASMAALVEPSLSRTASDVDFAERAEASASQKYLWQVMLRKLDEPHARLDLRPAEPWPGWREYMANLRESFSFYKQAAPLVRSRWARAALAAERFVKTPWRQLSARWRAIRKS